jgi:hypothetical protein
VAVPRKPRSRRTALYAAYVLVVAVVSVFALGALLAAKTRQSVGPGKLEGNWLYDDTREGRIALPRHASTHLEYRDLAFDSYTDARGLRVSAPGVETPARVDVLLVGASYLYGWGLDQPDTLAAMLEANTPLRVANAAVPSGNALGAMRAVQEFADLEPRWVVYDGLDGTFPWNVCPCVQGIPTPLCVAQEYVAFDGDGAAYMPAPIRSIWAPPQGNRRMFETITRDRQLLPGAYWALRGALGNLYRRHVQTCSSDRSLQELGMDYALTRLSEATRAAGAELIVMYVPALDGSSIGIQTALQGLLARRANDFTLLDLSDELFAYRSTETPEDLRLKGDFHPNAAGNRLMARGLCRRIQAQAGTATVPSCDWSAGAAQKSK